MHTERMSVSVITLKTLEITNFKGISHEKLCFSPEKTLIRGRAGAGKSTIFDAWCWLLFGRDRFRCAVTEFRPLDGRGRRKDPLAVTEVSADFLADGSLRTLRRVLRETPGGRLTAEFYAEGLPVGKSAYDRQVGQLFREPLFYVLSDPLYFLERMSLPEKQNLARQLFPAGEDRSREKQELRKLYGGSSTLETYQKLRLLRQEKCPNDLPYRISELEGILRQLGIPDYEAMARRCRCLHEQRDRLLLRPRQDPRRLRRILSQLEELCREMGLRDLSQVWGQRLVRLRDQQQRAVRRQRQTERDLKTVSRQLLLEMEDAQEAANRCAGPLVFRLFSGDAAATGGVLFQGMGVRSLSRTERVRAGLELISFFSRLTHLRCPVFLEEVPDLRDPRVQMISLVRDEDARGLEVE